ncbi:MAG: hypothetical protein R3B06_24675 [Kofleriaceae bacterium]
MKFRLMLASALAATFFLACGPSGDDTTGPPATDTDNDGITDAQEGIDTNVDTDGDGIPDYQDTDSDGDGIEDYREAGDTDPATPPVDSDGDGTPDFRDTDSDNNGRPDGVDGAGDVDGDGQPDFADPDDDGDGIADTTELTDPANPADTDGDGTPDFQDTDSDNDTILDRDDGVVDYDGDGVGNWRDTDSDGDCRSDQIESGGVSPPKDTDGDTRPDFNDLDSDDDGLPDSVEDANCNGVRDGTETDAGNADTDGDGVSDLIEQAAGTDANDPADNPQANGDFVFIEPYQAPQFPTDDDLDFSSRLQSVDMYVLLDRSGSMSTEFSSIRSNLGTVISHLTCPPIGTGDPATCIPDLWAGAGTIGYAGSTGGAAYLHAVDVQPNPNVAGLPGTEPNGCCAEDLNFGVYAAVTGNGTASQPGCGIQTVNPRATCAGSPAANAGFTTFGYPCFRNGALPVVLLATDEPPISPGDTNACPNWNLVVRPAMTARSARLVGILGDGAAASVTTDLQTMARDTGAVDANAGNAPLVFNGSGSTAATAIENGIRTLANGVPLDLAAAASDDPADAVDAVAAFIDHLETLQLGTPACANMLTDRDSNGDSFPDAYDNVRAGTPVCWKLFSKQNTTVPATNAPQLFKATVTVTGDNVTTLDTRDVYFLVPPVPQDPPIE